MFAAAVGGEDDVAGNGEKTQAVEAACAARGWAFAAFDFRGHGTSAGTMLDLRPSGLLGRAE